MTTSEEFVDDQATAGLAQGAQKGVGIAEIPWDEMTLRDQFAMRALQGIIDDCGLSAREMAERCYEVADAMVAVRNRLSGWQPIETAPRDGSAFLARDYVGTCLAWFAEGGDELSVRNVDGDTPDPDGFTQWHPLPL